MKPYKDFEAKRSGGACEVLPIGGYVCQILSAKEETFDWGNKLSIAFDVCEGEYSGIFKRDYDNNTNENKKWRGIFKINVPKDDGTEQDGWKKRNFSNFIWAVEQSNPGFTWDWDEKKLKGKGVGLLYRNKEWEMNGRTGWTTEAAGSESIDNIRAGKLRLPKDKPLPEGKKPPVFTEVEDDDGDLPF